MNTVQAFARAFKRKHFVLVILSTLTNTLSLLYCYQYRFIIDCLAEKGGFQDALPSLLMMLGVLVVNVFLNYFTYSYYLPLFKIEAANKLRKDGIRRLVYKPYKFFYSAERDIIQNYLIGDTEEMGEYLALYYFIYIANTLRFIITFAFLAALSPMMSLIVLLTIPLYYFSATFSSKRLKDYKSRERASFDGVLHSINETVAQIKTIKAYAKEEYFASDACQTIDHWTKDMRRYTIWLGLVNIIRDFVTSFMPIGIMFLGVLFAAKGTMTIGALIAFLNILDAAYLPVGEIVYFRVAKQTFCALEERKAVFDRKEPTGGFCARDSRDMVSVEQLSFSYNEQPLISNLSFSIKAPGVYLLAGRNGIGKSTLLNIIAGLQDFETGRVSIRSDLKVAYMPQENAVFEQKSLEENIRLGGGSGGDAAGGRRFSDGILKGDSAGEQTQALHSLSGGEQRKVCIDRTLSLDADIYLLDEPSENLDAQSRAELIERIRELGKTKAVLLISHDKAIKAIATEISCESI